VGGLDERFFEEKLKKSRQHMCKSNGWRYPNATSSSATPSRSHNEINNGEL